MAARIAQFGGAGGPRVALQKTYSPGGGEEKIITSGGIGGLDPYKDIEEDGGKLGTPDGGWRETEDPKQKASETSSHQVEEKSSDPGQSSGKTGQVYSTGTCS